MGERAIFRCPQCGREVALIANSDAYSDTIILSFGKNIEGLEKELEKEIEERFSGEDDSG